MSPSWFGYNPGDHAAITGPWSDPSFNTAVAALKPGNIRYPSGTAANYWDWVNGCEGLGSMGPCKTVGVSTLEKFAVTLRAANASAVFVLNMLTDTLDSQLKFLAHAASLGIPVTAVELGNEFYNADADYVKQFKDGKAYGAAATTWMAAVRAAYPSAAISVVGVPASRQGHNPRLQSWNADLFSTLQGARAGDGVSMHEYDATGAGTGKTFTEKDVPVMLATPFANVAAVQAVAAALPAWSSVWVTGACGGLGGW